MPTTAYHILVIANETCPCPALLEEISKRAFTHGEHRVSIVAPALNSRLRHFVSDADGAVEAARERLDAATGVLAEAGTVVMVELRRRAVRRRAVEMLRRQFRDGQLTKAERFEIQQTIEHYRRAIKADRAARCAAP